MKLQETLRNWSGIVVNVITDEDVCDIICAVKYQDHGDEFLVVKTNEGTYQYGYFYDRPGSYPDNFFIKKPILKKEQDYRSRISNEIFFHVEHEFKESHMSLYCEKKEKSKEIARKKIMYFKEYIESVIEGSNVLIHKERTRDDLYCYMRANDITEKEDLELLDSIKLSSFSDYDGTAGKVNHGDIIVGDEIIYVLVRGRKLKKYFTKRDRHYDEFGFDSITLSLRQFN